MLCGLLAACSKPEIIVPQIRPALAYKIPASATDEHDVYAGDIHARVEADHAFRVGGKIIQRLVDAGSVVSKGQPLDASTRKMCASPPMPAGRRWPLPKPKPISRARN